MMTIVLLVKYNEDFMHTFRYAIETFGVQSKYILLDTFLLEHQPTALAMRPSDIKAELMEKLEAQKKTLESLFDAKRPKIILDCEFGSINNVLENGWKKNLFDLAIISPVRRGWFKRLFSTNPPIPLLSTSVPILIVPPKERFSFRNKSNGGFY